MFESWKTCTLKKADNIHDGFEIRAKIDGTLLREYMSKPRPWCLIFANVVFIILFFGFYVPLFFPLCWYFLCKFVIYAFSYVPCKKADFVFPICRWVKPLGKYVRCHWLCFSSLCGFLWIKKSPAKLAKLFFILKF